jgi:hypothetical protein
MDVVAGFCGAPIGMRGRIAYERNVTGRLFHGNATKHVSTPVES